jgi:HTH-type transcriptional regulator, sugar sensing transcriptional regulator
VSTQEDLMAFSLTKLEADVYASLVREGEATGYELAKRLAIARSNVYQSCARLVERGLVRESEAESTVYVALSPERWLESELATLAKAAARLRRELKEAKPRVDRYLSVRGRAASLAALSSLIASAKERLYLCLDAGLCAEMGQELEEALLRGISVHLITPVGPLTRRLAELAELGQEEGRAVDLLVKDQGEGTLRAIADSRLALSGELRGEFGNCVESEAEPFVTLVKDAIRNEMLLARHSTLAEGKEALI